jgi:hypothetical protein
MNIFNWQNIVVAILLVMVIINFFGQFARKKALGERLMQAPKGLRYADMGQLFMVACTLVLIGMMYFGQEHTNTNLLTVGILVLILITLTATFFMSAFSEKGIYKNGVSTNTGPILYTSIEKYEIERKEKRNQAIVTFTTGAHIQKFTDYRRGA